MVINTRVGVGAHNMRTQFVEKTNDDRDSGAHVREDDAPLDKVKMSQSSPCLTVRSGEVQSPQYHRGQNCRVHQHPGRYKETYQGQGCGGDEAGCGGKNMYNSRTFLTQYEGAGVGDLSRFDPQRSSPAPGLYLY